MHKTSHGGPNRPILGTAKIAKKQTCNSFVKIAPYRARASTHETELGGGLAYTGLTHNIAYRLDIQNPTQDVPRGAKQAKTAKNIAKSVSLLLLTIYIKKHVYDL